MLREAWSQSQLPCKKKSMKPKRGKHDFYYTLLNKGNIFLKISGLLFNTSKKHSLATLKTVAKGVIHTWPLNNLYSRWLLVLEARPKWLLFD
jgi:hypothetical protein